MPTQASDCRLLCQKTFKEVLNICSFFSVTALALLGNEIVENREDEEDEDDESSGELLTQSHANIDSP